MNTIRFYLILIILVLVKPVVVYADACEDVFPSAQNPNASSSLLPLVSGGSNYSVGKNTTLVIAAGQNHVYNDFEADKNFTLNVSGTGTARLHIEGDLVLAGGAAINANGNPEDLVIYVNGNVVIDKNADINALIWASGNIDIDKNGSTNGALSANGSINIGKNSSATYDAAAVAAADFAGMCGAGPEISIADADPVKAGQDAIFVVSLNTASGSAVTVDYITVNGSAVAGTDYTSTSGTLTITAGNTTANITVSTNTTGSGGFQVQLSNASGTVITAATAQGSIYALPVAQYQFEELWNGTAGEVKDSSGNGLHGQAISGANSSNATPPDSAISGDPGTCRFGDFDGSNEYVSIPDNALLDISSELTVAVWIYPRALPSSGLDTILSKDENYEFHLTTSGQINWWWNDSTGTTREIFTSGTALSLNTWYHVAISYRSGSQKIYIDGVERGSASHSGNLIVNNDPLLIATDLGYVGPRNFNGLIDEVNIFNASYSQTGINYLRQQTHPCVAVPTVSHYAISHSGTSVTCQAVDVTVTAHDVSHNTVAPGSGTQINLATSTGAGDWQSVVSGNGSLANGTVNDGTGSYTFVDSAETQAVLSFTHRSVGPVNFNISSPAEHATEDANLVMAESGFIFLNASDGNTTIPTQIAGKPSSINPDGKTLSVQAVRASDNDPAFCVAMFASGTTGDVDLAAACVNPNSCAGLSYNLVNGNTATGISTVADDGLSGGASSYTSVPLLFGADGRADFVMNYGDAGEMQLNARYNLPLEDGSSSGIYMVGESNAFVLRPFGFDIDLDSDLSTTAFEPDRQLNGTAGSSYASNATSTSYYAKAGDDFQVRIRAVQWQATDDTDNNGIPDAGVNLTDNTTTENFSNTETVTLTPVFIDPTGWQDGSLNNAAGMSLTNGELVQTISWTEVGIANFTATLESGSYLLSGSSVTGVVENVGRFTPHHFIVDTDAILPSGSDYSYLGQPFIAQYEIHAVNANGDVTKNYTGAYNKLNIDSDISYGAVDDVGVSLNSRLTPSAIIATMADGKSGVISVPLTIARNASAVDDPFNDVVVGLLITDSDGVSQLPTALDIDTTAPTGVDHQQLGSTAMDLYYGRVYIPPAYGPETPAGSLDLPFELQYWDGTAFVTNTNDSDSRYDAWTYTCDDPDPPTADTLECYVDAPLIIPGAPATVSGGLPDSAKHITITRPGAGNTGSLEFTLTVDSWLQYDWDADGTFTDNPSARVTFGSYRGHDKIIYWRETE